MLRARRSNYNPSIVMARDGWNLPKANLSRAFSMRAPVLMKLVLVLPPSSQSFDLQSRVRLQEKEIEALTAGA